MKDPQIASQTAEELIKLWSRIEHLYFTYMYIFFNLNVDVDCWGMENCSSVEMCHFETQIGFRVWANTAHNLTPVYLHNSHSRLLRQKEGSFPEWQRSWKNAFITPLKTAVARLNPTNRPDFGALSRKSSMGLPTKSHCLERSHELCPGQGSINKLNPACDCDQTN